MNEEEKIIQITGSASGFWALTNKGNIWEYDDHAKGHWRVVTFKNEEST